MTMNNSLETPNNILDATELMEKMKELTKGGLTEEERATKIEEIDEMSKNVSVPDDQKKEFDKIAIRYNGYLKQRSDCIKEGINEDDLPL